MSATATSLRDPRLLAGLSAFTWTRIYLAAYFFGLILWIPVLILAVLGGFTSSTSGLVLLVIPIALVPMVFGLIARWRTSKESAAGYTTILRSGGTLDLLDSRSGAVIWRVGDPPVRSVGLFGTLRGEQAAAARSASSAEAAFPPKKASSWLLQLLPFLAVIVGVIVVVASTHGRANALTIVPIYLATAAFAGLIFLIVYLQTRLTLGRRIRALSALRPESMIFTSTVTRSLPETLAALGIAGSRSGRFPVVVTESGIEFWASDGDAPWLSVPWTDVRRVDPDTAPVGNNSFRAVTFSLEHEGRPLSLTLPVYGRQAVFTASPTWANQVFDELQFHIGPTRAAA